MQNQNLVFSFAHVPIAGDLAYADAWLKEEKSGYITPLNQTDGGAEYDKILNDFYSEIEVLSSTRPYMVAAGQFNPSSLIVLVIAYIADPHSRKPRGELR